MSSAPGWPRRDSDCEDVFFFYIVALVTTLGNSVLVSSPQDPFASTDRDVMDALFRSTRGSGWTRSDNWNTDADLSIWYGVCLLYTSPSPRDRTRSRMPSSA